MISDRKFSTVGGLSRTPIRFCPRKRGARPPSRRSPKGNGHGTIYRPAKCRNSYRRIGSQSPRLVGSRGPLRKAEKTGGQSSRNRSTNFDPFRCFTRLCANHRWTPGAARPITASLGCVEAGDGDVGVSSRHFQGCAPEMVAFPRAVRGISDAKLLDPRDETP